MTGQTLSRYKIQEKIGENAIGRLHRAHDTEADRPVAIWIFAAAIAENSELRERVEKEALAASGLEHPHLAKIIRFSIDAGTVYAVMEAPSGESLFDKLDRERPRRRQLLRFARQMVSALSAVHATGLVHGPLNPNFIFISPTREIKFFDFGLGVIDAPPEGERACEAAFGAAVPYVSPEQIRGAVPDARSDIFSLGALLYQMTTGRRAFRGDFVADIWKEAVEETPKPIGQVTSRPPKGMDKLLDRCLPKNPQRRFQQVSEILPLLDKMAADFHLNPKHEIGWWTRNRRRMLKGFALALTASAVVAGAVVLWRSRAPEEPILGKDLRQVTHDSGYDTEPGISADGTQLAFASDRGGGGNLDVWVQPVSGGAARRLTTDPADDHEPSFSPDGQTIAFRSERNGGGVYVVSAQGGEARLLAPDGRRPRYSPDGLWVAYWVGPPGFAPKADRAYKIFVVPATGGAPRQIQPNFASCAYPIWSPDSRNLLFLGQADAAGRPNTADWFVTSIEGGQLLNTGACASFRTSGVAPDAQCGLPGDWKGNQIFFAVPEVGGSNIWRAEIAAGMIFRAKPMRVTKGSGIELAPSASGDTMVFASQTLNVDIWSVPLPTGEGQASGEPRRLTRDPGIDVSPSISADGATLSFQSNRGGQYRAWLLDTKSGKESTLQTARQEQIWPLISPNGLTVAYSEQRIGKFEHFYKPVGERPIEVLCENCGPQVSGWSHDSKLVLIDVFTGSRRRLGVSFIELGKDEKFLLLAEPQYDISQARFSPDGRWIAFSGRMDGGAARVFVAPFRGKAALPFKEWIPVTDGASFDIAPQWSPDGKMIYFISTRDGFRCVWAQRLDAGERPSGAPFAVSHFHSAGRTTAMLPFDNTDLFVGAGQILVSLGDTTGNIWSVKLAH